MRSLKAQPPVHGTCVALDGHAALILGRSGVGKSTLGLFLMGMGATLVSDDRVALDVVDGAVVATAPAQIRGMIEARGVGVLHADIVQSAPLALVIDLDEIEVDRLPLARKISISGVAIPLLHRVEGLHFHFAVLQMMRKGRYQP